MVATGRVMVVLYLLFVIEQTYGLRMFLEDKVDFEKVTKNL
jgi:hypothetical protein